MLRSPLLPIFLTVFVDVLGLTLVLPLLPFYAEHFGASPMVVSVLPASFAVCQLVSGPVLGALSDRFGRKPTLLVSQMGTLVSLLVIGSANTLAMLFVGRIIDGLTAGNLSIAQAYISDVTKPENRTKAFALIGIAFGTGFLVGPAISGVLAHRYGFAAPAFGAAALSLLSILTTAILLPAVPPRPDGAVRATVSKGRLLSFRSFFDRPLPRRRLVEFFAFTLSFATLIGGLALFLERRHGFDIEQVGYVYAFSGFVGALIQGGLIGRLVKRFGEEKLSLVGFIAMAVAYSLLGIPGSVPGLLVLVAIAGFGIAVARPCLTTMLTKSVGPEEQGAVLGVSQSLTSISQILGNAVWGILIERRLLVAYGLAAGAFALVGVVLRLLPTPLAAEEHRPVAP